MNRRNFIKNTGLALVATLPVIAIAKDKEVLFNPDTNFEKFCSELIGKNILDSIHNIGLKSFNKVRSKTPILPPRKIKHNPLHYSWNK